MATTSHIGEYIQDVLHWKFKPDFPIAQPSGLQGDLLHDCHHIVQTVGTAFETIGDIVYSRITTRLNESTVRMPWSIVDYTKCLTKSQNIGTAQAEAALLKRFPPKPTTRNGLRLIRDPCIVVDFTDRIIVWYLPNALTQKRHVRWPHFISDIFTINQI